VLLCLCQILCTSWVTSRLGVILGVDSLRVGFESDSSSLDLPYNERGTTHCNYDDLITIRAQGEPAACTGDQGGRCCGIIGRSARSHAPQM
jgi:hypothetical protein